MASSRQAVYRPPKVDASHQAAPPREMNALLSVSRRAALRALSLAPLALPALIGRAQAPR
ncbi:MAG: hypothetical protein NVS2B11_05320 [Acetobacteraceae bacterium]